MTTKEELKSLVDLVKKKAKNEKKLLRNEDIASRLKMDRTYFSSLLGTRGQVTENHIKLFKAEFREELGEVAQPATTNKEVVQAASMKMLIEEVTQLKALALGITYSEAKAKMQESTIAIIEDILGKSEEKR